MNKLWLQIFMVMIGGNLIKISMPDRLVWVIVDLAILGIAYSILRPHPTIDLKNSMIFLSGLTVVSVLTDLGMIGDVIGGALTLALLGWMMFNRRGNDSSKAQKLRHKWNK